MKNNFIILLLFLFFLRIDFCYSQISDLEQMVDNVLKIRQKPTTENLLTEYLSVVDSCSDTLYAILFRPMNCPRCEAMILPFFNTLKNMYPENETLLIACHEDSLATVRYLEKNGYNSDFIIIDKDKKYNDIFSFNTSDLSSLFILKINKKEGKLIVGGVPAILSNDFIKEIHQEKNIMPFDTFLGTNKAELKAIAVNNQQKNSDNYKYERINIHTSNLYPVSSVSQGNGTIIRDGLFMYTDELANEAYIFEIDKEKEMAHFKGIIVADSIEKRLFVDVPEDIYQSMIKNREVFYIANGINYLGKDEIGVSYSLPKMFMETESRLSYYNQPAIIVRNKNSLFKEELISLDFDLLNESYMYLHFTFFPMSQRNRVITACRKLTWPIEVPREEYEGKPEKDPFMNEFYSGNNPIFAVFDTSIGKLVKRFGKLEESQRKSRTGYYFLSPVVDCYKSDIVYGNGYSGKLYLARQNKLNEIEKKITVFEIDTVSFPSLDETKFHNLEHARVYDKFFNRTIESVILTSEYIHCLIKTESPDVKERMDRYEYICFDREGKEINRYDIYPETDNERILSYGLAKEGEKGTPYYFGKQGEESFIKYVLRAE